MKGIAWGIGTKIFKVFKTFCFSQRNNVDHGSVFLYTMNKIHGRVCIIPGKYESCQRSVQTHVPVHPGSCSSFHYGVSVSTRQGKVPGLVSYGISISTTSVMLPICLESKSITRVLFPFSRGENLTFCLKMPFEGTSLRRKYNKEKYV